MRIIGGIYVTFQQYLLNQRTSNTLSGKSIIKMYFESYAVALTQ